MITRVKKWLRLGRNSQISEVRKSVAKMRPHEMEGVGGGRTLNEATAFKTTSAELRHEIPITPEGKP